MLQALTTLKQKVRKYNKDFEAEIESFRENPVDSEEEREEEAGETAARSDFIYNLCIVFKITFL